MTGTAGPGVCRAKVRTGQDTARRLLTAMPIVTLVVSRKKQHVRE